MAGPSTDSTSATAAPRLAWFVVFALIGLAASSASTWVHLQILNDPAYASFCDVNSTFSCTEAYSSRYGSLAGVPVAIVGVIFFTFVLGLVALSSQSATAAVNLAGYVFVASTIGLAVSLYLAYASFVILKAVCVLCAGTYVAVIGLFLLSGSAIRYPMTSLPTRAVGDLRLLFRTPSALAAAVAFVMAAGAAVAYKPVFAKWAKQQPGKVRYLTRDYPLERQCNVSVNQDLHPAACEAAVAVRLAREKGKADEMEDWLFANQPSLTPESVKSAAATIAGVNDFDARLAGTLELVKADIAQGAGLKVSGTPTFFMNGMRLPGLRAEYFDAAIAWELRRVTSAK